MIKFSIIIVTLNPGKDLKKTVDSVKSQTYFNYEIVIKDGESSDGAIKLYEKMSDIKVVVKKDCGIYDAMNQAIAYTDSDYSIFMNAGDVFRDDEVLQSVADVLNKIQHFNDKPTLVYGNAYFKKKEYEILMHPTLSRFVLYRTMICHQAIFFATDYLKKEKYNTSFKISGDYELLLRALIRDKKEYKYINRTIAIYEGGGFSETPQNIQKNIIERKQIQSMYFGHAERIIFEIAKSLSFPKLRKKMYNTKIYQILLAGYRNTRR